MLRFILFTFLLSSGVFALAQSSQVIPNELIVHLQQGAQYIAVGSEKVELISAPLNIHLVSYPTNRNSTSFEQQIIQRNKVISVVPNKVVTQRQSANDEHYSKQWNLMKIGIERAWGVTTGGTTALGDNIVVAILDSGYDIGIQDIKENLHINRNESPGDANGDGCPGDCGVDDDKDGKIDEDLQGRLPSHPLYNAQDAADDDENGFIDDIRGLNLQDETDVVTSGNHGTAVAGIIGAKGNNKVSVSGINWDVGLMLLSDVGNIAQIIKAYTYVYEQRRMYNDTNGALGAYVVVTNFSSGIDNEFGKDYPSWCNLYDLLGSVGVISVGSTTNKSTNVDEDGDLPSTCDSPYLIVVTNLTEDDTQPTAGYGKINVDLGAPGNGAVSLEMGGADDIGNFSGTSSAAPHVAGAIALLHSIPCEAFAQYYKDKPSKVDEIKDHLLESVDPIADLVGRTVSEGRLNIYNTMVSLKEFCPGGKGGDLAITRVFPNPSSGQEVTIEYDGPDGDGKYEFLIFDVLGKLVHTEEFNPPLYGERVVKITAPTLASGAYFYVIRSENDVVSHKQVVIPY